MSTLQTATGEAFRPEPGLARGAWEAPRGFFIAALALAIVLALGWGARLVATRVRRGSLR